MKSVGTGWTFAATGAAAVLLCVLAGAFGTGALPLATRTLVWAALIGVNCFKWWAWYHLLAGRYGGSMRADLLLAVGGAVLLNLTLPLEIAFVYRAVGLVVALDWLWLYGVAVVMSLTIGAVVAVAAANGATARVADALAEAEHPGVSSAEAVEKRVVLRGIAARADAGRLIAVTAEDHYVRLHLEGETPGSGPLLLQRFADALADLAALEGAQVHRGAWVAARGIAGARRQGRRWTLQLGNGLVVSVSDRHVAAIRARGWLSGDGGFAAAAKLPKP